MVLLFGLKSFKNRIKTIHLDGCVEYENGTIAYLAVEAAACAKAGEDRVTAMMEFLNNMSSKFKVEIYLENHKTMDKAGRYSGLSAQGEDIITEIIKFNMKSLKEAPRAFPVAYGIKAKNSEIKRVKHEIAAYPNMRIAEKSIAEAILRTDVKQDAKKSRPTQLNDSKEANVERGFMVHLE